MTTPVKLDDFLSYRPSPAGTGRIVVRGDRAAEGPVSERLFGLFTEHLGKNVYGGAWAQVLANGGFEPFDAVLEDVPEHQRPDLVAATRRRLEIAAQQFRMPDLPRHRESGLAPYWAPAPGFGGREVVCQLVEGFNGWAQRIQVPAGAARAAGGNGGEEPAWYPVPAGGIETPLFLPLHRIETYEFSAHVRVADGPRPTALVLQVWLAGGQEMPGEIYRGVAPYGLDRRGPLSGDEPDRLLGEERIALDTPAIVPGAWAKVRALVRVRSAGVAKGARLKLRLWIVGSGTVDLDCAKLFPTDAVCGWDPDVVRLLRELKVSVLRFPGGNFASGYHWKDGIGPVERRPEKPNPAWPEWEPNHVGVDEWLALCELIGAEPLICVNAGNGTPEEAAEWVRYCNDPETTEWGRLRAANGHPAPYNVRLWEVGNELWGSFQIGWAQSEEYGKRYAAFARAMKEADPTIELLAVGGSMPDVLLADPNRRRPDWLGAAYARPALENDAGSIWAIAEHAVMGGALRSLPAQDAYMELIAHTHHVGALLKENRRVLAEVESRALVAQTEQMVAVSGPQMPSDQSLAAAIVWAGFMNWFLRSGGFVPLFTRSALINHGDLLEKVREVVYPLPGYWGQYLYANQPGRVPVAVEVETPVLATEGKGFIPAGSIPAIDSVALLSSDRTRLTVIAVNRDPRERMETVIEAEGLRLAEWASVRVLAGPSYSSRNEWDAPNHVAPLERTVGAQDGAYRLSLPPHSITVMVVDLQP